MVNILGIDPGSTGGIAIVTKDHPGCLGLSSASSHDYEVVKIIKEYVQKYQPYIAVVERVASFPGQGVSSTFTFGKRYGVILGALAALGVPFTDVPPVTWNKALGLSIAKESIPGETDAEKKKRRANRRKLQKSKNYDLACRLYPDVVITKETADGLLLAEYGRRFL